MESLQFSPDLMSVLNSWNISTSVTAVKKIYLPIFALRFKNLWICFSDIEYLKSTLHISDVTFWEYLQQLTPKDIKVYAIDEGNVVFPRVPLLRVEGPVVLAQLLETVLLNLVNFASLVATNAARHRLAAGKNAQIYEMGLRRAQGPDGGLSASKYSYLGEEFGRH